jgi:hypothetical protein
VGQDYRKCDDINGESNSLKRLDITRQRILDRRHQKVIAREGDPEIEEGGRNSQDRASRKKPPQPVWTKEENHTGYDTRQNEPKSGYCNL